MSLHSMETGRAGVSFTTAGSTIKSLGLVVIVIFGFLLGQVSEGGGKKFAVRSQSHLPSPMLVTKLVGSSGGALFLAEFVITSISLVLGGAGTISGSAMESWFCFFCLSLTAFCGYLFGRIAIMEGIRQKKSGFSSMMLRVSLLALGILWLIVLVAWKWETPAELVILRPFVSKEVRNWSEKYAKKLIQ